MKFAWVSNVVRPWPEGHRVTFSQRAGLFWSQPAKLNNHALREHVSVPSKKTEVELGTREDPEVWDCVLPSLSRSPTERRAAPLHRVEYRPLTSSVLTRLWFIPGLLPNMWASLLSVAHPRDPWAAIPLDQRLLSNLWCPPAASRHSYDKWAN